MENKTEIEKRVSLYQLTHTSEWKEIEPLIEFLNNTPAPQLFDRKNFNGHITSSAFVLNDSLTSLLLINHKKLNRWLQPGGHVDETDSNLVAAAIRETAEETGLAAGTVSLIDIPVKGSIFDIDSHTIPENINKNEPLHVHHDCRFLFKSNQTAVMQLNPNEATGLQWVLLVDLLHDDTFGKVAEKIINVLNNN